MIKYYSAPAEVNGCDGREEVTAERGQIMER